MIIVITFFSVTTTEHSIPIPNINITKASSEELAYFLHH